jgi:radical SAM superfamily enzyme YgiQ (UPF0313 family)
MNKKIISMKQQMNQIEKTIKTSSRSPVSDLDCLPFPDRSLINYEKYNRHIGLAKLRHSITMQASRGCPYDCAYCFKIWPKKHVFRSAENILEEVKLYYDMGFRRFAFINDIFNLNVKNSSRFFRLIIKSGMNVQICFPTGIRGDILTKDYIDLMVEAGTVNIALALETASPRLQKFIKKNLDLERLKENIHYLCSKYPDVISDLFAIYGFPTETEEEVMMTLNYIKDLKWMHFPYIYILKIYPNTDMEKLALENGISRESILKSMTLGWNELPATIPFAKDFALNLKNIFLDEYFLLKERLLHVLPYQMQILTEDEIVQKYNSYLSLNFENIEEFLQFVKISANELGIKNCRDEDAFRITCLNDKMKNSFPGETTTGQSLRVLLLDISQSFPGDSHLLDDINEVPLGLMYIMTYLKRELGSKVNGKIAKSRVDFENEEELRTLLTEFAPGIIGIRTLTFYREFMHNMVEKIRQWGFEAPVIAGGPYATSDYLSALKDENIDVVVLGEGEKTFTELVRAIIENEGKLPGGEVLKEIPGIAFVEERLDVRRRKMDLGSEEYKKEEIERVISHFNDDLEKE